ncbi:MAG: ankyrin repeat domain-containing protein [Comamonadaceae bacterium]|nr:ankyrin repeat domain-containing protein [Comamonadaceae bacterium]
MAWRNDIYAVKRLLNAKANPNAIGDMGETPLHVAISQESPEIIQALLQAGAKTNIRSEFNVDEKKRQSAKVAQW